MARPKKQVKLKEPIKIRLKSLADGNKSIYLDIYYKGVRKYEYLKLYLVPEINPVCKEQNKQTMAIAERIKAERTLLLKDFAITSCSADINARSFRWNSSGILHGVGRSITTIFHKKYNTKKADIHYRIRFQSVFMYTSTH